MGAAVVIVAAVFALCLINGFRKGFIKALTGLISGLLALFIAIYASGPVAGLVFDKGIAPSLETAVAEKIGEGAGSVEQALEGVELPGLFTAALESAGVTLEQYTLGSGEAAEVARQLVTDVVRPATVTVLRGIAFIVLFLVVSFVARMLLGLLDKVFKLPLLSQVNKTLGGVAGALSGAVWALIVASVIQIVAASGLLGDLVTLETVDSTFLVGWLASVNPVGEALQGISWSVEV